MAGQKKKLRYSEETPWFPEYYIGWIGIGNCGQKTSNYQYQSIKFSWNFITGVTLLNRGATHTDTRVSKRHYSSDDNLKVHKIFGPLLDESKLHKGKGWLPIFIHCLVHTCF